MADNQDIPDDFDQLNAGVIEQVLEEYGVDDVDELDDSDIRELMQRKEELVTEQIFDQEDDEG